MRIAVVDSGVNPSHPHIVRVDDGASFCGDATHLDYLGHGTAVMAAIQEKAPHAEYAAVRIFHRALRTDLATLEAALEWSIDWVRDGGFINLSLGVRHPGALSDLVARATSRGIALVTAVGGVGSILADADATLARDRYEVRDGIYFAAPFPRPIPGLPPERNLSGVSFAVANVTGLLAREALRRSRA